MPVIDPNRLMRGVLNQIAPDVWYLPVVMSNVYFVGRLSGPWVLIDAGTRAGAARIRTAAQENFGTRPEAILLTHGHFDHIGGLPELADTWGVPIYAHRLEMPFLTGQSDYPAPDPTVGGFMAQTMSRMFPHRRSDFGERVRMLPPNGSVPHLPDWQYVETPGHTSGHISFFRGTDRTLIAGDALITVNQENPAKLFSQLRELRNPPAYLTQNWEQARESVRKMADLHPITIAAGHGLPMAGPDMAARLDRFATAFSPPKQGRYVRTPVRTSDNGSVIWAPPPYPDPLPRYATGLAMAAATGAALLYAGYRKSHTRREGSEVAAKPAERNASG